MENSWFNLLNIKGKNGKQLKTENKKKLLKIYLKNHKEYRLDPYSFCCDFVSILKEYVYDKNKKVYTEHPLADNEFCDAVFNMLEKTDKQLVKRYAFMIFMSIFFPKFHGEIHFHSIDTVHSRMIIHHFTKSIISASHNFCDLKISLDFMKKLCAYFKDYKYEIKLWKVAFQDSNDSLVCAISVDSHNDDFFVKTTREVAEINKIIDCYIAMLSDEANKNNGLFSVPDSKKAQRWFDTFCNAMKNFFYTKVKELDTKDDNQLDFFKFVFEKFLIQLPVKFKTGYGFIAHQDVKNLIDTINKYFPSSKEIQSEMILYLFTQFDFFKDIAGIKTSGQSRYQEFLVSLKSIDASNNDQIDKIKNLYLKLLSYANDPQLLEKDDKDKVQLYFDKLISEANKFFNDELEKHEPNKQADISLDFRLSLKFVISMAMDIKTKTGLSVTYKDVFMFADIVYRCFPSSKEIQSEMILYLFTQFDVLKYMYGINLWDESGQFSLEKLLDSLDGAKNNYQKAVATIKMVSSGRKGLVSISGGNLFSFEDLLPEVLLKQVKNYNKNNEAITDKQFNLQGQVFGAADNVWEKLGQILQFCIIKNTKGNDLKFLNLSTVFGFLRDKEFNIYDYVVKLEKLYSHISDALLNILVNKFEFEMGILANAKPMYTKSIKDLTMGLLKSLLEEANINIITKTESTKDKDENKNTANEINIILDEKDINSEKNLDENRRKQEMLTNAVNKLSNDIVDVVLKRFGSLYGFICKFKEAVVPHKDGSKILAILNFAIDFIFDKDKGSGKSIASLLIASLSQIDWQPVISKLKNFDKKEIPIRFSRFCLKFLTCTKFLDCETNIYQKMEGFVQKWKTVVEPKLKITDKLIGNLQQIMSDKNFIELARNFGIDKERLSNIGNLLNNAANLKVEDCLCVLYLTFGMSEPDQNLDLIFELAKKFHKEYEEPTMQIKSNKNKDKIITIEKNVLDIMEMSDGAKDEIKKVDADLKKSADIQLKTFIWTFQNRLQFLFEKTNLLVIQTSQKKLDENLQNLLACSYILANLLKFVYNDRFGDAIIKEISNTDVSQNHTENKPSWTEKWVSVFENFNKIFDKCKILGTGSTFFDMNIDKSEKSESIVNEKYGIHIYLKNISDVLQYFTKQNTKFYPEENKNKVTFNQLTNNLQKFDTCMTKAINNAKKTWETLKYTPWKKETLDSKAVFYTTKNSSFFFNNVYNVFKLVYAKCDNQQIISMERDNLLKYFRKLWTWFDFRFTVDAPLGYSKLDEHDNNCCFYCKKFDNISLVINYVYQNRIELKKSDANDSLLVALCSVEKLLDKVIVHEGKEITLKNLEETISDVIYYFRYLKDREKGEDKTENSKSNTKKNQIIEINDSQNNISDDIEDEIKTNEKNEQTDNTVLVKKKNNLDTITSKNRDEISMGEKNRDNKIQDEQSEKQLDNNVINIDETNKVNKNKDGTKGDIAIKKQDEKNRAVDNKSNNQQQKSKVDLPYVETGLVVYKPNQLLEEIHLQKQKDLMLSVISYKKINMNNEIIKNLFSKKNQIERAKQTGLVVYKPNQLLEIYDNEAYFKRIQNLMLSVSFYKEINMNNEIIKNLSFQKKSSKREKVNKSETYDDIENKIKNNSDRNINHKNEIENNNNENREKEPKENSKIEIKNNNGNKKIVSGMEGEKQNIIENSNKDENQNSNELPEKFIIQDIVAIKIPKENPSSGFYISKQSMDKSIKNENKINDKKIDGKKSNIIEKEPDRKELEARNEIEVDINKTYQNPNNAKLNNTNLKNKIDSENSESDKKSKMDDNNKESDIDSVGTTRIKINKGLENGNELKTIKTITYGKSITQNAYKQANTTNANNTGVNLKSAELNQNPNQQNLCFVFIFVGIVFLIVAVIFLTNIIWTWFVMNFFAQLAIMVFCVVLACICIFKHKSLWQKLYYLCKSKYQNTEIPNNDISYNKIRILDEMNNNYPNSSKMEQKI